MSERYPNHDTLRQIAKSTDAILGQEIDAPLINFLDWLETMMSLIREWQHKDRDQRNLWKGRATSFTCLWSTSLYQYRNGHYFIKQREAITICRIVILLVCEQATLRQRISEAQRTLWRSTRSFGRNQDFIEESAWRIEWRIRRHLWYCRELNYSSEWRTFRIVCWTFYWAWWH